MAKINFLIITYSITNYIFRRAVKEITTKSSNGKSKKNKKKKDKVITYEAGQDSGIMIY